MKQLITFTVLFFAATLSFAHQRSGQKAAYPEWEDKPTVHPVPPEYANEPAIILLQDVKMDYMFEGKSTNVYYTTHKIIKVLDDKGIEYFNKVGIPVNPGTRVPSIKARTILPNGKVLEITKEMIKVTKDEYGRNKIVFAMDAVEKNAEIELLIKEIKPMSYFGSEVFQYTIPVLSTHFSMSYPKELVFREKGYSGFPDVKDTLIGNRRHIDAWVDNIPKLLPEPNSFYDLHRMRMEYLFDHFNYPNENNWQPQYTWSNLGKRIYDSYYKITNKERAAVNAYLTEIGVKPNGNELQNLKKIENGIKTGIVQYDYVDYDERKQVFATHNLRSISLYDVAFDDTKNVLDSIISKRAATPSGIIKLFVACFIQAGINHELGVAGDRHEKVFDSKFENWENMDYHLFYFPDFNKYLSPTSINLRYPMVPEEVLNAKGVFCTIPPNGIPTGQLSEIRTITPLAGNQTQANIAAAVFFTDDMDAHIDISYSYTGYLSTALREEITTEPKDQEKDLVKRIVAIAEKPGDIVKYTITNESFDNYCTNKPLEITATVNAPQLTQLADKNYLFKVGQIIGPQHPLYNDDERILPVDLDYPSSQNRTITLNLPAGYTVLNPEALRMSADYVNREVQPVISFNSDYTLTPDKKNGDKLVITIHEFYNQLHFSPENYERYRKVVNTAAGFYKTVLLIAPKKSAGKHEHSLTKK